MSEIRPLTARDSEICPMLVPVTADRLWMYPTSAYCRRLDRRVRVPAAATLARVCLGSGYRDCAGYRASLLRQQVQADIVEGLWGGARGQAVESRNSGL